MGKLTAAAVKAAKYTGEPNGRPQGIDNGEGLDLQLAAGSSTSWLFRFTPHGKARGMGHGVYGQGRDDIGLSKARLLAAEARALLRDGRDPIKEREAKAEAQRRAELAAAENTFKAAAEALIKSKAPGWKNEKHVAQWRSTLEVYTYPQIGKRPVAAVDTDDVRRVLEPIWEKVPETASRVRGRIEGVLNFAMATGLRLRGPNPAIWRGHLAEVLGKPTKLKAAARRRRGKGDHHPSLPWQEMPTFMKALATHQGMSAQALQFAILTAARTGEVRAMTWREVNETDALWVVPSARMKAGVTHFVPLSSAALAVLSQVKPLAAGRDSLVFPGRQKDRPLSDMTLSMRVRGMATDGQTEGELPRWRDPEGQIVVPHGFRATFKAWSLARSWADHLSEKALAHVDKDKVRAAYAREPLTEERRPMMEAWGRHCTGARADC